MKKLLLPTSLLLALVLGFAWGFVSHREKIFPFNQLRVLAFETDLAPDTRRMKFDQRSPAPDADDLHKLEALGYVESTYDPEHDKRGVVLDDASRVYDAPRFYDAGSAVEAYLIRPDGAVLHHWQYPMEKRWNSAFLLDNGDILSLRKEMGLMRLSADSELVWKVDMRCHHDLDVFEDTIYVLTRKSVVKPAIHPDRIIAEEFVTRLTMDGELIDELSVVDALIDSPYRNLLPAVNDLDFGGRKNYYSATPVCLTHANHVEVMDGSLAHLGPIYKRGNLLVGMRNMNTVMIIDPDIRRVVWAWGPNNLVYPHNPVMLDTGHIMIFNNGHEHSEVVEIDPLTYRVYWRYSAEDFFSPMRGGTQRLPNGNTLITESDTGWAFEVTGGGDRVWEFANPNISDDGKRAAIWRVTAYPKGTNTFVDSFTSQ